MRPDDACNFCLALLDAHCSLHGEQFCKLKEEYLTTDLSADEMLDRFYSMVTDEQLVRADPEVMRRLEELSNPGLAAAQRWLDHYRNGKDGQNA
ncbi:MAG: hypothetical protein ACPLRW_13085 [Moorellales bacterium]